MTIRTINKLSYKDAKISFVYHTYKYYNLSEFRKLLTYFKLNQSMLRWTTPSEISVKNLYKVMYIKSDNSIGAYVGWDDARATELEKQIFDIKYDY